MLWDMKRDMKEGEGWLGLYTLPVCVVLYDPSHCVIEQRQYENYEL